MPKIMACTVAAATPRNKTWASLQSTFLNKSKYVQMDKFVVINGCNPDVWTDKGYKPLASFEYDRGHPLGLKVITDEFRGNDSYEWLLLLDSDAWPINDEWFAICDRLMNEKNKLGFAAIRCENFDTFPHPCIFFAHKSLMARNIEFKFRTQYNLLGEPVSDMGTTYPDSDADFLPLVRTNKLNFHPLFGGVYGHMFYHHGAGSRVADRIRLGESGMCDHYIPRGMHGTVEANMFSALEADPAGYLSRLVNGVAL